MKDINESYVIKRYKAGQSTLSLAKELNTYPKKIERILKKNGIKNILVEGGGTTNWAFVKENLVDEAIITITPYLVGGMHATTLVDGDGFSTITKSIKLKLKNVTKTKNEVVLHYEN